jgi:hypothetical protein
MGAFSPRFSNADSKPSTQRAAMAQQIRLSAPRNISSLKLRSRCETPTDKKIAQSLSVSMKRKFNTERLLGMARSWVWSSGRIELFQLLRPISFGIALRKPKTPRRYK